MCMTNESGGLGIVDLEIMNLPLYSVDLRSSEQRAWSILLNPLEKHERKLSNAAVIVQLSNKQRSFFWNDKMDSRCSRIGSCIGRPLCHPSGTKHEENSS